MGFGNQSPRGLKASIDHAILLANMENIADVNMNCYPDKDATSVTCTSTKLNQPALSDHSMSQLDNCNQVGDVTYIGSQANFSNVTFTCTGPAPWLS